MRPSAGATRAMERDIYGSPYLNATIPAGTGSSPSSSMDCAGRWAPAGAGSSDSR
ncbi:hypothetical protein GCM10010377_70290 [Streptomyces viridiviolaceus]|nr:hypothetical protein GCM10010377_70290 [Streptomyces viridiviolaceus]